MPKASTPKLKLALKLRKRGHLNFRKSMEAVDSAWQPLLTLKLVPREVHLLRSPLQLIPRNQQRLEPRVLKPRHKLQLMKRSKRNKRKSEGSERRKKKRKRGSELRLPISVTTLTCTSG